MAPSSTTARKSIATATGLRMERWGRDISEF
jgi:hypothetical protein